MNNQEVSKNTKVKDQIYTDKPNKAEIKKLIKALKPVDYTFLAGGKNGLSISADTAVLDGFFIRIIISK